MEVKGHFLASPQTTLSAAFSFFLIIISTWPEHITGSSNNGIFSGQGNNLLCVDSQLGSRHNFEFYAKMGGIIIRVTLLEIGDP